MISLVYAMLPPSFRGVGLRLSTVLVLVVASPAFAQSAQDTKPRASLKLEFAGLDDAAQSTLQTQLRQKAQAILLRARVRPAKQARDLWIRAKIEKREDEDGNLGFNVNFLGIQGERHLRWPELGRRCTYCTQGELVDTFSQAFGALVRRGLPAANQDPVQASKAIFAAKPPARESSNHVVRRLVSPKQAMPPIDASPLPRQAPPPTRWWGWMGLGVAGAGVATMAVSLIAMPRNVPMAQDPTKMFPARPDRGTKMGLGVGAVCVSSGVALWLVERMTRPPSSRNKAR